MHVRSYGTDHCNEWKRNRLRATAHICWWFLFVRILANLLLNKFLCTRHTFFVWQPHFFPPLCFVFFFALFISSLFCESKCERLYILFIFLPFYFLQRILQLCFFFFSMILIRFQFLYFICGFLFLPSKLPITDRLASA